MAVAELVFEQDVSASAVRESLKNSSTHRVVFRSCFTEYETPDDIKEITEALNPDLQSLTVIDCLWFDDDVLGLISKHCSQLSSVTLSGSLPKLTATGISSLVTNCADLKSLEISSSESSISEAELRKDDETEIKTKYSKWSLDDDIFYAFLDKASSSLEHFSLGGFDRITSEGLTKFAVHEKTTLEALELRELPAVGSSLLAEIGTSCPSLKTVTLSHCKLTDEDIEGFCSRCKLLQSFDVSGCEGLTDSAVISVAKHCTLLENFKIRWCLNITGRSLGVLATNCPQLKSLDISHCTISHIPVEFLKLQGLKDLHVDGCQGLRCPPLDVASKGIEEIRNFLEQCDIQCRCRLTFLGCQGSGKTSLMSYLSLVSVAVADVPTEGVNVSLWKPFVNVKAEDLKIDVDEDLASLSVELWDCGGRRCLHGIHPLFLMDNSLYVIVFDIGNPRDIKEVPNWMQMVQCKAPGSPVILVGTHADSDADNSDLGQDVLQVAQEAEQAQCNEIQAELDALRELSGEQCVEARISRLEELMGCRPKLPDKVVFVSTLKGKGIGYLQLEILQKITDCNSLPHMREQITAPVTYIYAEILRLRAAKTCIITWDVYVQMLSDAGVVSVEDINETTRMLKCRGCILIFHVPAGSQDKGPSKIVCVHPGVLLNCLARLHCEVDPREYVPNFVKSGMLEKFWPTGAKPNEWTLRSAIDDIVTKGLIRESVIPLCSQLTELKEEVLLSMVSLFTALGFLVEGAPKGSYDVELLLAYYKNMSVFKRYYLPLQNKLPKDPPDSVWPNPLPDQHIQVGWRYKFRDPLSADLCALLMGACRNFKKSSEIRSYWQIGMILQVGSVSARFVYDDSTLDVIGRCKITHGSKQALNMTWFVLAQFYYVIEVLLGNWKGLCPEIIVPIVGCNRPKHKPLCELIRDYNSQLNHHTNYRWFIPPADLGAEEHTAIPADMITWLSGIARKATLHISYHSDKQDEVKLLKSSLELAGFDCVGDWTLSAKEDELSEQRRQSVLRASLFIAFVTSQYLESTRALQDVKLVYSQHKSVISVLFDKTGWPADDELGHLLSEHAVCLDLNAGTGTGLSHLYEPKQLTALVDQCNGTLYGTGDIHPPEPPLTPDHASLGSRASQILNASNLDVTTDYPLPSESRKTFSENASVPKPPITENLGDGKVQEEMRRMAASAVAAAVAGATAQHLSKTNKSAEAIEAATTAAEVAQAVVDGDSDAASRGVVRVAQIVEESANREIHTVTAVPNGVGTNGVGAAPPKSSTCIVL